MRKLAAPFLALAFLVACSSPTNIAGVVADAKILIG